MARSTASRDGSPSPRAGSRRGLDGRSARRGPAGPPPRRRGARGRQGAVTASASAATSWAAARNTGSGPHLNDVFGREAGSLAGFRYSRAMREAGAGGLVWTAATLDAFIAEPRAVVARSRMSFKGMEKADDRAKTAGLAARVLRRPVRSSAGRADLDAGGVRSRPQAARHRGRSRIRRLSGRRMHHLPPAGRGRGGHSLDNGMAA